MRRVPISLLSLTLLAPSWLDVDFPSVVAALNFCSEKDAGGVSICPEGNVCCATGVNGTSSCLTQKAHRKKGTFSVCCVDHGTGVTGCMPGYTCASKGLEGDARHFYCKLISKTEEQLPPHLPRYKLCSLAKRNLEQVHALTVGSKLPHQQQLAYYSSMGSLDTSDLSESLNQRRARVGFVIVHGSERNADDYLCCSVSAISKFLNPEEVIVLAPRFLAPEDGPINVTSTPSNLLRWNETDPIPHTWRYGADAINSNISSYDAMDTLIERLASNEFPLLDRIIVAGHSAGGQLTQRWALTSSSQAWTSPNVSLQVIVANPRSFCYLDARRFMNGTLQLPTRRAIDACPAYNSWEWGLDQGGDLPTPYKDRAIEQAGGPSHLAYRYTQRNVVYLAGQYDTLPVHSSCEDDDFQGSNRRQRSRLFFSALNISYKQHRHHRKVVRYSPHDHCLMFQSKEFRSAVLQAMPGVGEGLEEGN